MAQQHQDLIIHHRGLLGHAITSLTLHPSMATTLSWLRTQNFRPQGDLAISKPYYSPNLHMLQMVTEQQVAAARAAASAFDENDNRVSPTTFPLGPFHLFPLFFTIGNLFNKDLPIPTKRGIGPLTHSQWSLSPPPHHPIFVLREALDVLYPSGPQPVYEQGY